LKITIVLPAKNEEEAIANVLDDVGKAKLLLPSSITLETLVMDSSITDETAKIARSKGAKVVYVLTSGKGNAFRASLQYIINSDIVIMSDADYTYPLGCNIAIMIGLLASHDVVIGCRTKREPGSMTPLNLFGNRFLSALASFLYHHQIKDVCSGLWGFRINTLLDFNIISEGFTLEADLMTNAIYSHCRIAQFPIGYRARQGESSAKFKPVIDWFKILGFLIKRRFVSCRPL